MRKDHSLSFIFPLNIVQNTIKKKFNNFTTKNTRMENWQRNYIVKNLPNLIAHTKCSTTTHALLQSMKIFGPEDMQDILSKGTEIAKASRLYELAQTRIGSYAALLKVFHKTNQTGALKILEDGISERGLLEMKISYEGKYFCLKDLMLLTDLKGLEENLKVVLSKEKYFEMVIEAQKYQNAVKLVKDTIPKPVSYYIERMLSKRMKIDPLIFKEECPDIFVFDGIPRAELTDRVKPHGTAVSTDQLITLTARFIILKDGIKVDWEEIVAKALEKNVPAHLIRYEDRMQDKFILIQTSGNSNILQNFLHHGTTPETTPSISEQEFIRELKPTENSPRGICICDSPGMGKSLLLANIGRKISNGDYCNSIVSFVPLSQLLTTINKPFPNTSDAFHSIKLVLKYICPSTTEEVILLQIIQSKLVPVIFCLDALDEIPYEDVDWVKNLFSNIAQSKYKIKLLITARPHMRSDLEEALEVIAYDIVPFTEENQISYLKTYWLRKITAPENTISLERLYEYAKLCLSKLKKFLPKQERELMGIPLQCYLLAEVNFEQARIYSDIRREISAEKLLKTTNSLFDLFKSFADLSLNKTTVRVPPKALNTSQISGVICSAISVVNFLQTKYTKYIDNRMLLTLRKRDEILSVEKVREYHVWKAIQLLFPELAAEYSKIYNVDENMPLDKVFEFGILEPSNTSGNEEAHFVHRTIAEFLVSQLFGQVITGTCGNSQIYGEEFRQKILHTVFQILKANGHDIYCNPNVIWFDAPPRGLRIVSFYIEKFENPLITSFLNWNLQTFQPNSNDKLILHIFSTTIGPKDLSLLLNSCVTCDSVYLLRLVKGLLTLVKSETLMEYKRHMFQVMSPIRTVENFECYDDFERSIPRRRIKDRCATIELLPCSQLLHLASEKSTFMLKDCFDLLESCFQWNISMAENLNRPAGIHIPFHRAVDNADYEMVEYLGKLFSVKSKQLLYYCVEDTQHESLDLITRRKDICDLLLRLDGHKSLVRERAYGHVGYGNESPLLASKVHIELLKYLIKEKADVASQSGQKAFMEVASFYMSTECFEELIHFLKQVGRLSEAFDSEYLLHRILRKIWLDRRANLTVMGLQMIFEATNITPKSVDEDGNSLLLAAVKGQQSVDIIEEIIRTNANLQYKNKSGKTALHLAGERGNMELVEYLLACGLSLEEIDNQGSTPLLASIEYLEITKFLLDNGANFGAVNSAGDTFLHLAATKMKPSDFFELCEFLVNSPKKFADIFLTLNKNGECPLQTRLNDRSKLRPQDLDLLLSIPDIGINVNYKCGNNLLFAAIKESQPVEILEILVKRGANYSHVNHAGENALHLAVHLGRVEVISYILSLGVSAEQLDKEGMSSLDKAIKILKDEDSSFSPRKFVIQNREKVVNLLQKYVGSQSGE